MKQALSVAVALAVATLVAADKCLPRVDLPTRWVKDGDTCKADYDCKSVDSFCRDNVCVAMAELSAPCNTNSSSYDNLGFSKEMRCVSSLYDYPNPTSVHCIQNVCTAAGDVGASCGTDRAPCKTGLYCDEDSSVCTAQRYAGQSCSLSQPCEERLTCSTKDLNGTSTYCMYGLNGDTCSSADGCYSGICTESVCTPKETGASCEYAQECGSNDGCTNGLCTAFPGKGENCKDSENNLIMCADNNICVIDNSANFNIDDSFNASTANAPPYICVKPESLKDSYLLGFSDYRNMYGESACKSRAVISKTLSFVRLYYCAPTDYQPKCSTTSDRCMEDSDKSVCLCDGQLLLTGEGTCGTPDDEEDSLHKTEEKLMECMKDKCDMNIQSMSDTDSLFGPTSCGINSCSKKVAAYQKYMDSAASSRTITVLAGVLVVLAALFTTL